MTSLEAAVEFATNPEPRCACVLVLDTSASMGGAPIKALNEGIHAFAADVAQDPLARQRVEVCLMTFGGTVDVVHDFVTAGSFEPKTLTAGGGTPLGSAVDRAIDLVADRKATYKANGIAYYRPWVLLVTDGAPTDDWHKAAERVRQAEADSGLAFFAVGTEGADFETLGNIATRTPLRLKGLSFVELFVWLSQSQRRVSASRPGDQTALPPVDGWAVV